MWKYLFFPVNYINIGLPFSFIVLSGVGKCGKLFITWHVGMMPQQFQQVFSGYHRSWEQQAKGNAQMAFTCTKRETVGLGMTTARPSDISHDNLVGPIGTSNTRALPGCSFSINRKGWREKRSHLHPTWKWRKKGEAADRMIRQFWCADRNRLRRILNRRQSRRQVENWKLRFPSLCWNEI